MLELNELMEFILSGRDNKPPILVNYFSPLQVDPDLPDRSNLKLGSEMALNLLEDHK